MALVSHSHLTQELKDSINIWQVHEWTPCCELVYQIGFQLPASGLNEWEPGQVSCGRRKKRCLPERRAQHQQDGVRHHPEMPEKNHRTTITLEGWQWEELKETTQWRYKSTHSRSGLIGLLQDAPPATILSFYPFTVLHSASHREAVMGGRLKHGAFPSGKYSLPHTQADFKFLRM